VTEEWVKIGPKQHYVLYGRPPCSLDNLSRETWHYHYLPNEVV